MIKTIKGWKITIDGADVRDVRNESRKEYVNNRRRLVMYINWEARTINIYARHQSENGTPMRAWHGLDSEWRLEQDLSVTAWLAEIRNALPVFESIAARYGERWDGNNYRIEWNTAGIADEYKDLVSETRHKLADSIRYGFERLPDPVPSLPT